MGEDPSARKAEVAALRLGLDLGARLIDTAEMYGEGGAEEVVGEAIRGRRDGLFIVTKFYPHHASRKELAAISGGERVAANQVLYNLNRRGIEFDLLPWCRERAIDVMAYSPLDEGPLARHPRLVSLAREHGLTAAQLALAWVLRDQGVAAIPKAANPQHVRANAKAAELALSADTRRELDAAFPPPARKQRLEVI